MLDRYLLVSISDNNEYPSAEKIEDIFSEYGALHSTILHPQFLGFFCVVYKWRWSVLRCLSNRKALYRKHGFIVEQTTSLQDVEELKEWSQDGGPVDPDAPSLLDLNDDCLLKIISFVPDSLECVCIRLRQLCLTQYHRSIQVDKSLENFNRVFHVGDKVKNLTWAEFDSSFVKIFEFMMTRCNNLDRLDVSGCDFKSESPNFENINSQLSELNLGYDLGDMSLVNCLLKVVKNLKKLSIAQYIISSDNLIALAPEILKLSSLHTVILLELEIDVGQILSEMPQLRVLFCGMGINSSIPEDHGLNELGLCITDEAYEVNYSSRMCEDVIKILKTCKDLQYLRISTYDRLEERDSDLLLSTIEKMQSLEGLYLTHLDLTPHFLSVFANSLRILFRDPCCHYNINLKIAKFSKLEVLSWDDLYFDDLEDFLKIRQQSPLKIVSQSADVLSTIYPDPLITWVRHAEDIFGSFSIFSV